MRNQEKIFVIGHKNPDTDSICSAIAYADIKNRTSQKVKYIPKRAGQIIAGAKPLIDDPVCNKPLSIAVEELYRGEVKIVPGEDEN